MVLRYCVINMPHSFSQQKLKGAKKKAGFEVRQDLARFPFSCSPAVGMQAGKSTSLNPIVIHPTWCPLPQRPFLLLIASPCCLHSPSLSPGRTQKHPYPQTLQHRLVPPLHLPRNYCFPQIPKEEHLKLPA